MFSDIATQKLRKHRHTWFDPRVWKECSVLRHNTTYLTACQIFAVNDLRNNVVIVHLLLNFHKTDMLKPITVKFPNV